MESSQEQPPQPEQPTESPLFEFAAPSGAATSGQDVHSQQPEQETPQEQGFIYPPPPSYYQNMQVPAERLPLPGQPQPQPLEPTTPARYDTQGTYYRQPGVQEAPPYRPGDAAPRWQPPTRRSRKQTWVIISIIGVCVLLLCGGGGWALYNVVGAVFQQVSGAPQVVQDFYQQVQSQNYTAAFNDLQISGQTATAFSEEAKTLDTQYGTVQSFQIGATSISSSNTSAWQITVSVTRTRAAYAVTVSVNNAGGSWKITGLDLTKF